MLISPPSWALLLSEDRCIKFKTVAAGAVAFVTEREQNGDQEPLHFEGGTGVLHWNKKV